MTFGARSSAASGEMTQVPEEPKQSSLRELRLKCSDPRIDYKMKGKDSSKRENVKGKTESDSGKMKMNNGQNKCTEVKFGLNQLPKMSRGKTRRKETTLKNGSGELVGILVNIITAGVSRCPGQLTYPRKRRRK